MPDDSRSDSEGELGAAVDEALADEVKRQRARFIAHIVGHDRAEGTGRSEAHRNDSTYRDLGTESDDPPEPPNPARE